MVQVNNNYATVTPIHYPDTSAGVYRTYSPPDGDDDDDDDRTLKLLLATDDYPQRSSGYSSRNWQWILNMSIIHFIEFGSESSRGVILATMFLYNKSLGGDLVSMGLLTSVFSLGRFISSLLLGYMCDRTSFRFVYLFSSSLCLVGNLLYLIADVHVSASLRVLMLSRFIVGFGAGNRSVCRANVAKLTSLDARLPYLTTLAMVVFLGYALTPGLGTVVGHVNYVIPGVVHINAYTAPVLILMGINVMTILTIVLGFDESMTQDDAPQWSQAKDIIIIDDISQTGKPRPKLGMIIPEAWVSWGVGVFLLLNVASRGLLSIFETINIPLFLDVTNASRDNVRLLDDHTQAASDFQFQLGLVGLLSYVSITCFRKHISDLVWLLLGFSAMALGNLVLLSTTTLSFVQLAMGETLVWSVGCPITTTVVVAAFSKMLGRRPQGTYMGLLGAAASVSRMVLPIFATLVSSFRPLFLINLGLCLISVVSLVGFHAQVRRWHIRHSCHETSPLVP